MEVYETTILRPLHKLITFCFLFCAVGTWSTTTSQHLDSGRCRTVRLPSVDVDCCVPCSAFVCQREHSVPDALPLRL